MREDQFNAFHPGGLALLNAADAFVAAPTPAAAPSLRGTAQVEDVWE